MMRRYLPCALLGVLAMAAALGLGLGVAAAPLGLPGACPNTQLGVRVTSGGSEASQPFVIIAVTNKGALCFVDGYPRITAVSGHKVQGPDAATSDKGDRRGRLRAPQSRSASSHFERRFRCFVCIGDHHWIGHLLHNHRTRRHPAWPLHAAPWVGAHRRKRVVRVTHPTVG